MEEQAMNNNKQQAQPPAQPEAPAAPADIEAVAAGIDLRELDTVDQALRLPFVQELIALVEAVQTRELDPQEIREGLALLRAAAEAIARMQAAKAEAVMGG
jgi:hypothetical protein